jgi:hypothetical protein
LTNDAAGDVLTTLADVSIDGGLESCPVGKTSFGWSIGGSVGLRVGWCAGKDDDGEEGNSTGQDVHDDDVWLR